MFIHAKAIRMAKIINELNCMKQVTERGATFALPLKQFFAANVTFGIRDFGDPEIFINEYIKTGIEIGRLLETKDGSTRPAGEDFFPRTTWNRYAAVLNKKDRLSRASVKTITAIADAVGAQSNSIIMDFWVAVCDRFSQSISHSVREIAVFTDQPALEGVAADNAGEDKSVCFAIVDLDAFCGHYQHVLASSPGYLRYGPTIRTRAKRDVNMLSTVCSNTLANTAEESLNALTDLLEKNGRRSNRLVALVGAQKPIKQRYKADRVLIESELQRRVADGTATYKDIVYTDGISLADRGKYIVAMQDNDRATTSEVYAGLISQREVKASDRAQYAPGAENMASKEPTLPGKAAALSKGARIPQVALAEDEDDKAIVARMQEKAYLQALQIDLKRVEQRVQRAQKTLKDEEDRLVVAEEELAKAKADTARDKASISGEIALVEALKMGVVDYKEALDRIRVQLYEARRKVKRGIEKEAKAVIKEASRRATRERIKSS